MAGGIRRSGPQPPGRFLEPERRFLAAREVRIYASAVSTSETRLKHKARHPSGRRSITRTLRPTAARPGSEGRSQAAHRRPVSCRPSARRRPAWAQLENSHWEARPKQHQATSACSNTGPRVRRPRREGARAAKRGMDLARRILLAIEGPKSFFGWARPCASRRVNAARRKAGACHGTPGRAPQQDKQL